LEDVAIDVKNISKTFKLKKPSGISKLLRKLNNHYSDSLIALDEISFSVKKGEILGIIGLNGSGKSTLLRVIAGVYKPDSGSVITKGKISPLMQLGAGFQADLDAVENITMNGMLLGLSKKEIQKKTLEIIQYAELEKFSGMKIKHYSSGMKARLAFSIAMQIHPDILLVDEIFSVGDKNFQKKSFDTFLKFKKEQKTILHASHNLEVLSEYSDKILLLKKGKIVSIGNPKDVIEEYKQLKIK